MKQLVLITAATDFQAQDEKTGQINQGVSLEYISSDRIIEKGETYRKDGYYSFKETISDLKLASKIGDVPCICEFTMQMKSSSKDRKPKLVVTDIARLKDFIFDFEVE